MNSLFAIHFVFRFLVLSGWVTLEMSYQQEQPSSNKSWTSTSSSTISIWISIPLIVALFWSLICVLFLGKNDVSDQIMKFVSQVFENFLPTSRRELNADLAYVGPCIDYLPNASHNLNVYLGLALIFLIGVRKYYISKHIHLFSSSSASFALFSSASDATSKCVLSPKTLPSPTATSLSKPNFSTSSSPNPPFHFFLFSSPPPFWQPALTATWATLTSGKFWLSPMQSTQFSIHFPTCWWSKAIGTRWFAAGRKII